MLVGEFTFWALKELVETKAILLDSLEPEIMNSYFGVEQDKPNEQEKNSGNGDSMD
jgi:hypothetical protein